MKPAPGQRPTSLLVLLTSALLTVGWGLTGCGSTPEEEQPIVIHDDVGEGPDAGGDVEVPDRDVWEDVDVDEIGPVPVEGDRDGDGIPDELDNCPDDYNPDQADRDRDGIGDVCDVYPFIYDPSNPAEFPVIAEDAVPFNDTPAEGEAYGLTLPFIIEGGLDGLSGGQGDIDFYSFEIDEPTAILVHIEALGASLSPAAIVYGYDWRNGNVQAIVVGGANGQDTDRDIFLPLPGRYTIAVTDLRNLTSQPDVGGANYDYRVSVSKVPLPAPTPLEAGAAPRSYEHDNALRVFEVDVSGDGDLVVEAAGASRDFQSALLPLLAVLDESDRSVLSYSIGGEVDDNTLRVALATRLAAQEKVHVIVDFAQAVGSNDVVVEVSTPTIAEDLETFQQPRDQRTDGLVWLSPGASIEGVIGPPISVSATQLIADTDYFLFPSRRGESYRIRVEPVGLSPVQPRVEVGVLLNDRGSSFFLPNHMAPAPEEPGPAGEVIYFVNAEEDGEAAIRLRHGPNTVTGAVAEGGPAYRYRVSVESIGLVAEDMGELPASRSFNIGAGGAALGSFTASAGDFVTVSRDNWRFDARVTARNGWREVGQSLGDISMIIPDDGEYWVDLRDFSGVASAVPVNVSVELTPVTDLAALPQRTSSILATESEAHAYRFSAVAGERLDVRTSSGRDFTISMQIYDVEALSVLRSTSLGHVQFEVPRDGEYIVRLSALGFSQESDFEYGLSISTLAPQAVGGPVLNLTGVVDPAPGVNWYRFDVESGKQYRFGLQTSSDEFRPNMAIYQPSTLARLRTTSEAQYLWSSMIDGEIFLSVYDADQLGSPEFEYTLRVEELEVGTMSVGVPEDVRFETGADSVFFEVAAGFGALDIQVDTEEPLFIEILAAQSLNKINTLPDPLGQAHYASSVARDYVISVRPARALSEPLSFALSVNVIGPEQALAVEEPNNELDDAIVIGEFPGVFTGSLGDDDREDHFVFDLVAGQHLWALTMDASGEGIRSMDALIELIDAEGTRVTSNRWSGEGDFPALYGFPIESDGRWQLRVSLPENSTDRGSYTLYVFVK